MIFPSLITPEWLRVFRHALPGLVVCFKQNIEQLSKSFLVL
jgi:hypothetical protein